MIYKSYCDMADTIRRNLWKVPNDVSLIVGIPRSGMIAALLVSELLNKPCATLDEFIQGQEMSCGKSRRKLMREFPVIGKKKVLVLDDTVNIGYAMENAKSELSFLSCKYEIVFACVYARGRNAKAYVDIFFEDIYDPGKSWYLYEWNILHHHASKTKASMWDIDGLLCKDPPSEVDVTAYESYISNAIPMIVPTTTIGALVTYRLEKYRKVTEKWLQSHGIDYNHLYMFDAPDRDTRNATKKASRYKAELYGNAPWARLFFESSRKQAEKIFKRTGKPVFCYENGQMFI